MTSWSSEITNANGIDIHVTRTGGDHDALVFLHGLMGSGACWTPVARLLANENDVVMPDARGHGGSSAPAHGYTYDELARDVEQLLGAMHLRRVVLVGHSMGGMTAAVIASRSPELLRGVVLVDPTFLSEERQRDVHASDVAEQHRHALASSTKAALVADARARHPHRSLEICELQADAKLQTCIAAFDILTPPNPDYRNVVRAIELPTVLVIGDKPVVTRDVADELRRINPRVRIEQMTDAGHGLPFDQPKRLADVIASFVRAL